MTRAGGTEGAETVVTVGLIGQSPGTLLRLTHGGFASPEACDGHGDAWPIVLEQLDRHHASGVNRLTLKIRKMRRASVYRLVVLDLPDLAS